jgi:hypothetical protein
MIEILIVLIVCGLLYYLVTLLPLPAPFPMIIRVVVILILIIWLLGFLGWVPAFSVRRP